jgi:hypothetical protein
VFAQLRILAGFCSLASITPAYVLENLRTHPRPPEISGDPLEGFECAQMPQQEGIMEVF